MSVYQFDDRRRSITIRKVDLPSPWLNFLSNGTLHAFASQAGGGCVWRGEPPHCRLTRYRSQHLPTDSPGFYVYIRHADGTVWSPTFRPTETPLDDFSATHEPGATSYYARRGDYEARLKLFITPDYDVLVWDLEITNGGQVAEKLDVFAYLELSQYDWLNEQMFGYYWRLMLKTWFSKEDDSLFYLFHSRHYMKAHGAAAPLVFFSSTRPIVSFCGDRDAFNGDYRDERRPITLERGICGNEEDLGGEPCAALHTAITCRPQSTERLSFFFGSVPGALTECSKAIEKAQETIRALRDSNVVSEQYRKLKAWWDKQFAICECSIPDENAQRQINIWSPVNCVNVARHERSVNAQAPGVRKRGFRDTCQDMLAMSYRDIDQARRMFRWLLTKQETAGNAITTSSPINRKKPDLGIGCDHHLWLPLLAHALVAESGDAAFLQERVPFLAEDLKSAGPLASGWEHLMAGVSFTENHLGAHGLPLTLRCDWNDIIGRFSEGGKGESVFAAQQYVYGLDMLIELARHSGATGDIGRLRECRDKQARSILKHCWNGKWWYRCFDDDGNPIGGEQSVFGKIWLNSQSWAVLSGVGSREQHQAALDAVEKYLDTGVGLIKLYPGFETWPNVEAPFSGYNPGNGENGAVFCHSNTWTIIAEAMMGNAERAWRYYTQLVPHNALQKLGLERYKAEPYAWASNIVGKQSPKHGWANVVHMTGAAAWMDIAANQYLLGLRPTLDGLLVDPCVPGWERFSANRLYRGCRVMVDVANPTRASKGIKYLELDGVRLENALIPAAALAGKSVAHIKAVMGA